MTLKQTLATVANLDFSSGSQLSILLIDSMGQVYLHRYFIQVGQLFSSRGFIPCNEVKSLQLIKVWKVDAGGL